MGGFMVSTIKDLNSPDCGITIRDGVYAGIISGMMISGHQYGIFMSGHTEGISLMNNNIRSTKDGIYFYE